MEFFASSCIFPALSSRSPPPALLGVVGVGVAVAGAVGAVGVIVPFSIRDHFRIDPHFLSFFLMLQVLPIERGAGLDQKLLLDFSRKLAAGAWCHIFPEGKTVQVGVAGWRKKKITLVYWT